MLHPSSVLPAERRRRPPLENWPAEAPPLEKSSHRRHSIENNSIMVLRSKKPTIQTLSIEILGKNLSIGIYNQKQKNKNNANGDAPLENLVSGDAPLKNFVNGGAPLKIRIISPPVTSRKPMESLSTENLTKMNVSIEKLRSQWSTEGGDL